MSIEMRDVQESFLLFDVTYIKHKFLPIHKAL